MAVVFPTPGRPVIATRPLIGISSDSILITMADKNALLDVIAVEQVRHPQMDERDLQKLIYQSVFGGDHLLNDPGQYASSLREEWEGLSIDESPAAKPALQSIDPQGKTTRIHLAVCKEMGIDAGRLIELLVCQGRKNGRRSDYERRWNETVALAAAGRISFSADELARVGYPDNAPHHGPGYGPASYRIINDASNRAMNDGLRRLGVRE